MSATFKLDQKALNRGVEEIVLLKPIRRGAHNLIARIGMVSKLKNDLNFVKVYGYAIVALTLIFATLFASALVVVSLHYLAPAGWRWLDAEAIERVQSILFSGGMGAVVSTIIQKQISKS